MEFEFIQSFLLSYSSFCNWSVFLQWAAEVLACHDQLDPPGKQRSFMAQLLNLKPSLYYLNEITNHVILSFCLPILFLDMSGF